MSDECALERVGLSLLAHRRANRVAVLNDEDVRRDVEEPIELIAVLTQVRRDHRMKTCGSLEQECAGVALAIHREVRGEDIALLTAPVLRHGVLAEQAAQ